MQDYITHATTVLCVSKDNITCMGSDGQISHGSSIIKQNVKKVRTLANGKIIAGFAGFTCDSIAILNFLEATLHHYPELERACIEMIKEWRSHVGQSKTDSLILVTNGIKTFILSGAGDIVQCEEEVVSIGSGGLYAAAAAKALTNHTSLTAKEIVHESLKIASDMCIYTNNKIHSHSITNTNIADNH